MSRRPILALAAGVAAAASLAGGPVAAATPAPTGKLLITRGTTLYSVNADGTGLRALGTGRTGAAWSPDGTRIAFSAKVGGNYDIYTMLANGTGVTRVTTSAREDALPTWSPDGKQLAFKSCSYTGGDYSEPICDIYRLKSTVPYGRAVKLTDSKVNPTTGPCARYYADRQTWVSLRWRSNGAELAVTRLCHYDYEPGWFEPEIISSVDGRSIRGIDGDLSQPDWSPNGAQLTWLDYEDYNEGAPVRLVRMKANGSGRAYLTPTSIEPQAAAWSPDGQSVAYAYGNAAWVVGANGTGRRKLISNVTHLWDWGR